MRQRVVIHIGTHKTGSTALQAWAGLNRPFLAARGIYYPLPRKAAGPIGMSHKDLVSALRADQGKPANFEGLPPMAELLEDYSRRIIRRGAPVTLLSAEALSAPRNKAAPAFAALADRFDVQVIVVLRRADTYLESFYRQKIKLGSPTPPFPVYRQDWLNRLYRGRTWPLLDWAGTFGDAALTVVPFEPARPGFDLLARFLDAAGLPATLLRLPRWDRRLPNPSLSRAQAEVCRRLLAAGNRPNSRDIRWIRRTVKTPGSGYMGPDSRTEVLARVAETDAMLCRRFVRDGREALFPEPPERLPRLAADWDGALPQEVACAVQRRFGTDIT